ncbi:MAG: energy transducer TonB [Pseudomonadales bacterium]|jgi:protein TonB|tara:strand:+ start:26135 stop:26782 length:648 start_codon:yes stop_codon:yes gene_type:complete
MILRISGSMIAGVVITIALLYLMQSLISNTKSALTDDGIGRIVDIVRVKQENEVQTKQRKAKKPPPPDQPPPDIPPMNINVSVDQTGFTMSGLDAGAGVDINAGGFGISDGEYLPIVKVQPVYPRRALSRGMSGWAIVEFTVSAQGTVKDPIVVSNCGWVKGRSSEGACEDSPNSVFDSAAVRAALKFKYKPKVIDGTPVETAGVQNRIVFELAE